MEGGVEGVCVCACVGWCLRPESTHIAPSLYLKGPMSSTHTHACMHGSQRKDRTQCRDTTFRKGQTFINLVKFISWQVALNWFACFLFSRGEFECSYVDIRSLRGARERGPRGAAEFREWVGDGRQRGRSQLVLFLQAPAEGDIHTSEPTLVSSCYMYIFDHVLHVWLNKNNPTTNSTIHAIKAWKNIFAAAVKKWFPNIYT